MPKVTPDIAPLSEREWLHSLALIHIPGIGERKAKAAIRQHGCAAWAMQELARQSPEGVDAAMASADKEWQFIQRYGITPLRFDQANYPGGLQVLGLGPMMLFTLGAAITNQPIIAVVGTRHPSPAAQQFTRRLILEMAEAKPTIVSGLALGVDAVAHRTALECGLPTVAVLGHGLDQVYPSEHRSLARRIVREGGTLMSPFQGGVKPARTHFPLRNSILAGMAEQLVMVESGAEGGAMIAAEMALNMHREVCVPLPKGGRHDGAHALLKRPGVRALRHPSDWHTHATDQAPRPAPTPAAPPKLSPPQVAICQALQGMKGTVPDELAVVLDAPTSSILAELTLLELDGVVRKDAQGRYGLEIPLGVPPE